MNMKRKKTRNHSSGKELAKNVLTLLFLVIVGFSSRDNAVAQEIGTEAEGGSGAGQNFNMAWNQIRAGLECGGLSSDSVRIDDQEKEGQVLAATIEISESPAVSDSNGEPPQAVEINADALKYFESEGGLSVGGTAEFRGSTVFKLVTKFLGKVLFREKVEFLKNVSFERGFDVKGYPIFSEDTAGYSTIKKGEQSVDIKFKKEYKYTPVVTVSLSVARYDNPEVRAAAEDLLLISDVKYVVTNVTTRGFEIKMDRQADSDIPFSWHALAINDPKKSENKTDQEQDITESAASQPAEDAVQQLEANPVPFTDDGPSGAESERPGGIGIDPAGSRGVDQPPNGTDRLNN